MTTSDDSVVDYPKDQSGRRIYPVELKLAAVSAVVDDHKTYRAAVAEFDISSLSTLKKWLISYRREGESALYPKPLGRPKGIHTPIGNRFSPIDQALLRMENEKLMGKLGG
ncbi:MAG: helix-turn-helix domain-containing protein [Raoultibacter sp.]